ncbi:MAG: hypothetical protein CVV64_14735 [Candidatus Wallbacteria bacterium HGW-Wallbacteria-1]|uniref:Uncharacterized protein n=1 Tax=Candidatus Wallbacteria bacterium HGW-Wallbacteria-1 TaxID=2013854 RepID=A0A2N1PLU2_9BACT|nr:MAG: hypothetical protein CVV64_14735 [Candidatus Wallbacteria bacterium HGW-Wallbacteria-1]
MLYFFSALPKMNFLNVLLPKLPSEIFVYILLHLLYSYVLFRIATKSLIQYPELAWVPIMNLFVVVLIAGKPYWWFFLLFMPFISLGIYVYLWMDIAALFKRNQLLV